MAENENRPSDSPNPLDPKSAKKPKTPEDDDAIDLGGSAPVSQAASGVIPMGGISKPGSSNNTFSWADIIGFPNAPGGSKNEGNPIVFDSVSDKDLLKRIVDEEKAAGRVPPAFPVPDAKKIPEAEAFPSFSDFSPPSMPSIHLEPTIFPEMPNPVGSSVKLDQPILTHGGTASGSVVRFDVMPSPSDAGGAIPRTPMKGDSFPSIQFPPTANPLAPPSPPIMGIPPTTVMFPGALLEAEIVSDPEDLIKTPSIFPRPKAPDAEAILFTPDDPPLEGGSVVRLGETGYGPPGTAARHASILDMLLGEEEIQDALSGSARDSEKIDLNQVPSDDLGLSPEEQQKQNWAAMGFPSYPSQAFMSLPEAHEPPVQTPVGKGSRPSMPPIPPPAPAKPVSFTPPVTLPAPPKPAVFTPPKSKPLTPGSSWDTLPTPPTVQFNRPEGFPGTTSFTPPIEKFPDFANVVDVDELFNPEEAVDLLSEAPTGGISDSGSLQVSDQDIQAANRRSRAAESSAIDLSSHPSISGLDLDIPDHLPSFRPSPSVSDFQFPEPTTLSIPKGDDDSTDSINLDLPEIGMEGSAIMRPGDRMPMPASDDFASEFVNDTSLPTSASPLRPRSAIPTPLPASVPMRSDDFESTPYGQQAKFDSSNIGFEEDDEPVVPVTRNPAPKPTRPTATKKGGWLIPSLAGVLIGAGSFAGAYFGGLLPNGETPTTVQPGPTVTNKGEVTLVDLIKTPSHENARVLVENGRFDAAIDMYNALENKDGATAILLNGRGQAHWFLGLKEASRNNTSIQANDQQIQKAILDLEAAPAKWQAEKTPEGEAQAVRSIILLGLIQETLGKNSDAIELYGKYENDLSPENRAFIDSAKTRLKVLQTPSGGKPMTRLDPKEVMPIFAILLLQTEPMPKFEVSEAGEGFWKALELANGNPPDYATAKKLLDAAVKKHKAQKLANPNKGLNPLTDPGDQIFEKACAELKAGWDLRNGKSPSPVDLDEIAKLKKKIEELTAANKELELLYAKLEKDSKGWKDIIDELVVKVLKVEQEKVVATVKDFQKDLEKALADKDAALKERDLALKQVDAALKERDLALKQVKELTDTNVFLIAHIKDLAKIDEKELVPSVKRLVIEYLALKGGGSSPGPRLDILLLLVHVSDDKKISEEAISEADKILTETKVDEYIAKSFALKGFGKRNLSAFVEARTLLIDASKHPGFKKDQIWGLQVTHGIDHLKDPESFIGVAMLNPSMANLKKELENVVKAMLAFPKEGEYELFHAQLLARRALIKLDLGDATAASTDANAAKEKAVAEGNLALGKIAERAGKYDAAIEAYTTSVAAAKPDTLTAKEASEGLMRAKLLKISIDPPTPTKIKTEPKTEPAPVPKEMTRRDARDRLQLSLILMTTLLAPEGAAAANAELLKEANDQIDKKIPEGYFLKAQALANQGEFKEAMESYVEGMRKKGLVPKDYEQTLSYILNGLKALATSGSPGTKTEHPPKLLLKNPVAAERFFNEGYRFFFRCQFFDAEQLFLKAIANADDARYYYFLALSQSMQGRDADAIFALANELERKGKPESRLIGEALERVQGEPRRILELKRP